MRLDDADDCDYSEDAWVVTMIVCFFGIGSRAALPAVTMSSKRQQQQQQQQNNEEIMLDIYTHHNHGVYSQGQMLAQWLLYTSYAIQHRK